MEKKVLVSVAERRRIAEEATVAMGSEVTQQVIDLKKVVEWMRVERKQKGLSPYLVIQPISEDIHKNRSKLASFQKDPLTGVLYGIALSADKFGNIQWQKIQINDMLSLNLDNENDAKIWAILRFEPEIQGSPFQKEAPYFKVYDPVDQAQAEEREVMEMEKAFERIRKLREDARRMVQFARYLGEDVIDNANYDIVNGILLKVAKNNAVYFNKKWESKARAFAEVFYSAVDLGIINEDVNVGYVFKGLGLGLTREEAVKFLARDKNVRSSVVSELESKDIVVRNVDNTLRKEKETTSEPVNSEFE